MEINNLNIKNLNNNKTVSSKFINIHNDKLNMTSSSLKTNFYLDSFNYFPITEDFFSFQEIFSWGDISKYKNFYSRKFIKDFIKHKPEFKSISNAFVLGSSSFNNYYTNIITFLPRIFFNNDKKIKLAIHRNSSNLFRNFIKKICEEMNIEMNFIYLDDQYYKFINSQIPEFLDLQNSVKILNTLKSTYKIKNGKKIYIQRKNCNFRNLINDFDLAEKLEKLGFLIVDLEQISILDQIELFATSEVIVGATGSGLANIVFCNEGVKIFEISPKYKKLYDDNFRDRYFNICKYLSLDYSRIEADPVDLDLNKIIDKKILNLINTNILKESNYYKNLLINMKDFDKLF